MIRDSSHCYPLSNAMKSLLLHSASNFAPHIFKNMNQLFHPVAKQLSVIKHGLSFHLHKCTDIIHGLGNRNLTVHLLLPSSRKRQSGNGHRGNGVRIQPHATTPCTATADDFNQEGERRPVSLRYLHRRTTWWSTVCWKTTIHNVA